MDLWFFRTSDACKNSASLPTRHKNGFPLSKTGDSNQIMLNHCRCKHKAGFEGRPAKDVQVASEAKADATQSDLRVLMKKKLEQMEVELREIMIYQSPPELGALWTEVLQQSKIINARQSIALKAQIEKQHREDIKHARFMKKVYACTWWIGGFIGILLLTFIIMIFVVEDRIKKYPQLGYDFFPKTEQQRREEAQPKKYIGR
jgi:hypothetical protein